MRNYKFRGKPFEDVDFDEIDVHISKDDFVYGNLIQDGDTTYIVNGIVECTEDNLQLEQWIRVRPETVGQFTGWYDRTKKTLIEICTGDVVKNTFSSEVFIVTWCNINGYYMLVPLEIYKREKDLSDYIVEMKPDFRNLYDYYNTLEIIGNIHDKGEER